MTAVQRPPLVLLDLDNMLDEFNVRYHATLLIRFTERAKWILHVLAMNSDLHSFHSFMPHAVSALILTRMSLFTNTKYYIYCADENAIQDVKGMYVHRNFVVPFHEDELPIYLRHAAINHLVEKVQHLQNEREDRDNALQEAAYHALELGEELFSHMLIQLGKQPEELR